MTLRALTAFAVAAATIAGCSGENDQQSRRELLEMTQQYLTDQVNTVTENPQANRGRGTNLLPMDRITGPLADQLAQEAPRIAQRRDSWRGTQSEHDWGRAEMVSPDVEVSGDHATVKVSELSELHYTRASPSTSYRVDHTLGFVRVNRVWKLSSDELDVPPGAPPLLEPYAR